MGGDGKQLALFPATPPQTESVGEFDEPISLLKKSRGAVVCYVHIAVLSSVTEAPGS